MENWLKEREMGEGRKSGETVRKKGGREAGRPPCCGVARETAFYGVTATRGGIGRHRAPEVTCYLAGSTWPGAEFNTKWSLRCCSLDVSEAINPTTTWVCNVCQFLCLTYIPWLVREVLFPEQKQQCWRCFNVRNGLAHFSAHEELQLASVSTLSHPDHE